MTGWSGLATLSPSGPAARRIDDLWVFMLIAGTAVFIFVAVVLTLALTKRRRQESSDGVRTGIWLVGSSLFTAVVITAVLVATLATMRDTPEDGSGADLVVEVTGHRWWWEVAYPDHEVVTANEVHIPAGAEVFLQLRSADVIHSFWVPELAGKKDLLPDEHTSLVIEADRPGTYRGQCAEFCGLQHANMGVIVEASEPDAFQQWLDQQQETAAAPTTDLRRRGAEVFATAGCGECHTIRGTEADGTGGPDLTHLASRRTLAAGALRNTTADLSAWIEDPHAYKEGVLMEPAGLAHAELEALVAYLEGLG